MDENRDQYREFLSAFSSFMTGTPSLQVVDALEPTEILYFTKADLDLLFTRSSAFGRFGRKIAEEIIVGSRRRTATSGSSPRDPNSCPGFPSMCLPPI
jgi:hypothetical protein